MNASASDVFPGGDDPTTYWVGVVRGIAAPLTDYQREADRTGAFLTEAVELMNSHGLLRLTLPRVWGGYGLTISQYWPVLQEVAKIGGGVRMFVHGQNGIWRLLHDWGTDEQKQRWLPVIRDGGLFGMALTEPNGGTGRDLGTRAEKVDGGWVINGLKHLISWAGEAELIHAIAGTGRDAAGVQATCFLVPKGTPGVRVDKIPETMGSRGGSHDIIHYENCFVPDDAVLGGVGQGLHLALRGILDVSRLSIAASCLGLARRSMELAVDFSRQRVTFGRPIADRQAVRLSIGEMAADIYAVQAALDNASTRFEAGQPIVAEAAMCKYLAMEMLARVTDRALRMHGGIGYTQAHDIERHYRDARALWFEEGTAEIQRLVIAQEILASGITF